MVASWLLDTVVTLSLSPTSRGTRPPCKVQALCKAPARCKAQAKPTANPRPTANSLPAAKSKPTTKFKLAAKSYPVTTPKSDLSL